MAFRSLGFALLMLVASPALAGDGHDARAVVEHIFEMADANGDGALTPSEYDEAGLAGYGVSFDDCDVNADGETSMAEYLKIYERFHTPGGELSV